MSLDIQRLEGKIDVLSEAIAKLVLFEERQTVQAIAISTLTLRLNTVEQKLEMWVNRGIGVWGLAAVLGAAYKVFMPY